MGYNTIEPLSLWRFVIGKILKRNISAKPGLTGLRKANLVYSLSRLRRRRSQNEDDLKIEDYLKNEDDLKNEVGKILWDTL